MVRLQIEGAGKMTEYSNSCADVQNMLIGAAHTIDTDAILNIYNQCEKQLFDIVKKEASQLFLYNRSEKYATKNELLHHAHHGSIREKRALKLGYVIASIKPKSIIEIGSYLGLSAKFFLDLTAEWGGNLTSIDPNIRHRCFDCPRQYFKHMLKNDWSRVNCMDGFWLKRGDEEGHYLNTKPVLTKRKIAKKLAAVAVFSPKDIQDRFDMAFIDGNHDYESVKRDFEGICKVMNPGGCVVLDDASWPGVHHFVTDLKQNAERSDLGCVYVSNEWPDGIAAFFDNGYFAEMINID